MKYTVVLNYSQYFKEPLPDNKLDYIRTYPTDYILMKLANINAILFQEEDSSEQTLKILAGVIFIDTPQADSQLADIILNAKLNHQIFFSSASISFLIKSCLENFVEEVPDQMINPVKFARDLFRTILIFNEVYYARLHGYDLETFEGIFMLQIMQQNYIRGNVYMKLITSLKFAFISKFLDGNIELKPAAIAYCQYFQMGNPWLFGKFFLEMVTSFSKADPIVKFVLDTTGFPPRLIEDFTIDKAEIKQRDNISFTMDLIPKPFYWVRNEYLLILDYNFFQFSIDQGFFYSLHQHTALKDSVKFKKFNAFKGYIGLHFFEQYLVRKHLEAIFYRKSQNVVSTEVYQDFIVKATSNNIFIFEVKMTDLHADTIERMDFNTFKKFLNENFLAEKTSGGKNKGIFQLSRQLDNLAGEDSALRNLLGVGAASQLNVYPVIIYSDANLDISGVNAYINLKGEPLMEAYRDNFQSLKPVLMMNVNTLLEYFSLLKTNPNALGDWINSYFKSLKSLNKRYQESKSGHRYLLANKSFTAYLTDKLRGDHLDQNITEIRKDFDLDIIDFGKS